MMLRKAFFTGAAVAVLAGCGQPVNDLRLTLARNELREQCFGNDTYSCRSKTIDFNIMVLKLTPFKNDKVKAQLTQALGEKGWEVYEKVVDDFVEEGEDTLDSVRPNIFARWFMGDAQPLSRKGYMLEYAPQDMVEAGEEIGRRFIIRGKKEGLKLTDEAQKAFDSNARSSTTAPAPAPAPATATATAPEVASTEPTPKPAYTAPKSSSGTDADLDAAVTAYIAGLDKDGGEEYPEGRQYMNIDLNGDGMQDAAVVFTIEGAGGAQNGYQTLAGFVHEGGHWHALPGSVVVNGAVQSMTNGGVSAVIVETLTSGPDDPDCCPSTQSRQKFFWSGEKFVEMPLKPKS